MDCPVWDTGSQTDEYVTELFFESRREGGQQRVPRNKGLTSFNLQIIPNSPSSFLRAGSRFTGTQQSERQVYEVQVEIKYVDLRESFLCGYLRIQGKSDLVSRVANTSVQRLPILTNHVSI